MATKPDIQANALDVAAQYVESFNNCDLKACMDFFHPEVRVVLLKHATKQADETGAVVPHPEEDIVVAHGLTEIEEGHKLEFDETPQHVKNVDYFKASLTPDGAHVLVSYSTHVNERHKVTYILDTETNTKCVCRVVHEITNNSDTGRRRSVA
eukprot:g7568.t1